MQNSRFKCPIFTFYFQASALRPPKNRYHWQRSHHRRTGASNWASGGPRGGPPQPIVQRRSFDPLNTKSKFQTYNDKNSDSWSFFNLGSSVRNKRKLPSGRETISDFTCRNLPPGYYADIKLGCEVS